MGKRARALQLPAVATAAAGLSVYRRALFRSQPNMFTNLDFAIVPGILASRLAAKMTGGNMHELASSRTICDSRRLSILMDTFGGDATDG